MVTPCIWPFWTLDNLQQISNQYSDTAASMVRQQVERLLRCRSRRIDVVARRYDGVCSIGMCETTKGNGAKRLAEILDVLHQEEFDGPNGTQIRLALRVGTAMYPEDGTNLQTLYHVANTARRLHL